MRPRGWYQVELVRPDSLGPDDLRSLTAEMARVYALAHGGVGAHDHFLAHRDVAGFREVHTARVDGELIAWFGVNGFDLDGRWVETLDDAVTDPRYHRRGVTRCLTLRIWRRLAVRALARPAIVAVLTTNPTVADAIESHLRSDVALYPAMSSGARRSAELQRLAPAVAERLHADVTFDPETGVLADFLPRWHLTMGECVDPAVRSYFDEHLDHGSALLMLLVVDRAMVARHVGVWIVKAVQTLWQRLRGRPGVADDGGPHVTAPRT